MSTASSKASQPSTIQDLIELSKPGIVRMCLIMTLGGLALASSRAGAGFDLWTWSAALLGTAGAVASANAFNMIWERESDRAMQRTRNRPLATGRLSVGTATWFAAVTGVLSALLLAFGVNFLTATLALVALLSYVCVYTPLKSRTPLALVIGALPGAMPPLLGWTAATNSLELPGIVLFAILMVWQMPHFLAIALFRKQDYAAAGIRCVPVERGDTVAKVQSVLWSALLIPTSLALTPLGVTGNFYLGGAAVLGVGFFLWSLTGLRARETSTAEIRWARGFFGASLIYLPALTVVLVLDLLT